MPMLVCDPTTLLPCWSSSGECQLVSGTHPGAPGPVRSTFFPQSGDASFALQIPTPISNTGGESRATNAMQARCCICVHSAGALPSGSTTFEAITGLHLASPICMSVITALGDNAMQASRCICVRPHKVHVDVLDTDEVNVRLCAGRRAARHHGCCSARLL